VPDGSRRWLSEWLLEFSVLWAVLPVVDQLLGDRGVDWRIVAYGVAISLTTFVAGLLFSRSKES
jgi:hypothetical protein